VLRLVEYQTKTVQLTSAEAAELARMTVGTQNNNGRPWVIERLTLTATPAPTIFSRAPMPAGFNCSAAK
jgi:hypothetical protein